MQRVPRRREPQPPSTPCEEVREALSARLDREAPGLSVAALDRHLAGCAACAVWEADAAQATRRARLNAVPSVPDLTEAVLRRLPAELPGAAAAARGRLLDAGLRLALLAVAVAQIGVAWPALVDGAAAMSAPAHMAHETGAWNLAIGVSFLAVAAVPRLGAGALPFLAAFSAVLVVLTLTDLRAGLVPTDRAVTHVLVLAGAALVSAVAWRGRRPDAQAPVARRRSPA